MQESVPPLFAYLYKFDFINYIKYAILGLNNKSYHRRGCAMKNILIIVPMNESQRERVDAVRGEYGVIYETPENVREEQVKNAGIIIGNVPPKFIQASDKLEFLQLNSSGADAYTAEGVLNKNTLLANAAGAYSKAVSEHMFALTLSLIKKLHIYRDNQNKCLWKDEGEISSLSDKTVAIIGLGDIGMSYAHMCKAFGARIIGVKRTVKELPEGVDELYSNGDINKALAKADVVLSIVPSTEETRGLFDRGKFDAMKDGAVFLNGGRGDAVNQDDLLAAVRSGKLSAVGIDVAVPEPLPADSPLWKEKNIFITPHIAGHYHLPETLGRIVDIAINNIDLYVRGKEITNKINH